MKKNDSIKVVIISITLIADDHVLKINQSYRRIFKLIYLVII